MRDRFGFGNRVRFPTGLPRACPTSPRTGRRSINGPAPQTPNATRPCANTGSPCRSSTRCSDDPTTSPRRMGTRVQAGRRTLEVGGDWYNLIDLGARPRRPRRWRHRRPPPGCRGRDGPGAQRPFAPLAPSVEGPGRAARPTSTPSSSTSRARSARRSLTRYSTAQRARRLQLCWAPAAAAGVTDRQRTQFLLDGRNVPLGGFMVRPRDTAHFTLRPTRPWCSTATVWWNGEENRSTSGCDRLGRAAARARTESRRARAVQPSGGRPPRGRRSARRHRSARGAADPSRDPYQPSGRSGDAAADAPSCCEPGSGRRRDEWRDRRARAVGR